MLADFPVDSGGQSTVLLDEGARVLAILFDQGNRPILLGFVSDGQTEVSVQTTVEASLYYALGTAFLPADIREQFFAGVRNLPNLAATVTQAEQLFQNDPNFFQSQAYSDLIRNYINTVVPGGVVTRLNFDPAPRSGLSLNEQQGDRVTVLNELPRRCLAFVYKISFKPEGSDVDTVLIDDVVTRNPIPKQEFRVVPTASIDSVIGTLQNVAAGKGIEYAQKESDPADLSLAAGEKEAVHSIRVVGPSIFPDKLSKSEEEKLIDLQWETALLDIALPIMFDMVGQNSSLKELRGGVNGAGDAALRGLLNSFKTFAGSLPGVNDNIAAGKFEEATADILEGIRNNFRSQFFQAFYGDFVEVVGRSLNYSPEQLARMDRGLASFARALDVTDTILKMVNYASLVDAAARTSKVEDFPVTTTRNPVTLVPSETIAIQDEPEEFEVEVQNGQLLLEGGKAFLYRWSTSGQYATPSGLRGPLSRVLETRWNISVGARLLSPRTRWKRSRWKSSPRWEQPRPLWVGPKPSSRSDHLVSRSGPATSFCKVATQAR